ncbi:DUF5946 family protein [Streptomyces sp. NPDC059176]|uniref:DUF5946 family protein n=1 Tax=unclassified Streptomyces TaxID=2593676 RepID=UPI0036D174AD
MTAGHDSPRPVRCSGCSARVADVAGPAHPYMTGAAGCWQEFSELTAELTDPAVLRLATDAYAVQHPHGGAVERRQRQSVGVHLTSLCLHLEHGVPEQRMRRVVNSISRKVLPRLGRDDWPALVPPTDLGPVTVLDVRGAAPEQRADATRRWAASVWTAWSDAHRTVDDWARAVLAEGK